MKISSIKADLEKVESGVWISDIPDFEGVRLKVRPSDNPDYGALYQQLVETTPRNLKRGGVVKDAETKTKIAARCLADTVLVDWDGFEDDDGKPLPYSAPLAKQWLLDPQYAAFRHAVAWAGNVAQEESRLAFEDNSGN